MMNPNLPGIQQAGYSSRSYDEQLVGCSSTSHGKQLV